MSMIDPYVTYEAYLAKQESTSDKLEYHNGYVVNMSPTSIRHNEIISNIMPKLKDFFKGTNCKAYYEQIGVVFEDENSKYEFQPDIFVISNGKTKGEKFISSPNIVFEVLSSSTSSNDLFRKPLVYSKFGVLEYNVVYQDGRIIQYGLKDGAYEMIKAYSESDNYKSFVYRDLEISLDEIFE